ncbi:hypothetical protein NDU88_003817 [Pleurodeles waltl]|uniref:Uncharacterized protein n=1 Tax=Pleurodeles waltl TaxID=8319 RepID=A0AAV7PB34_PLEWA|nr:hypothetical protein NDU88_003817 [Pleurodeles waltl]
MLESAAWGHCEPQALVATLIEDRDDSEGQHCGAREPRQEGKGLPPSDEAQQQEQRRILERPHRTVPRTAHRGEKTEEGPLGTSLHRRTGSHDSRRWGREEHRRDKVKEGKREKKQEERREEKEGGGQAEKQ